jgi:hypothetical protein
MIQTFAVQRERSRGALLSGAAGRGEVVLRANIDEATLSRQPGPIRLTTTTRRHNVKKEEVAAETASLFSLRPSAKKPRLSNFALQCVVTLWFNPASSFDGGHERRWVVPVASCSTCRGHNAEIILEPLPSGRLSLRHMLPQRYCPSRCVGYQRASRWGLTPNRRPINSI